MRTACSGSRHFFFSQFFFLVVFFCSKNFIDFSFFFFVFLLLFITFCCWTHKHKMKCFIHHHHQMDEWMCPIPINKMKKWKKNWNLHFFLKFKHFFFFLLLFSSYCIFNLFLCLYGRTQVIITYLSIIEWEIFFFGNNQSAI